MKPQAYITERKKEIVKELSGLLKTASIIGVVNMENLPGAQLQVMRAKLRDQVQLYMTKRRLMNLAIDATGIKALEILKNHLKGMPALMFTQSNPFKLYKLIKQNKSPAAAKAGQKAPMDLIIKAGPTPFAPGPVIGELGALGLKTGVEGGKVTIKDDKVVCKEGEEIKPNLASMLARLDIKPMEIGLDLVAVYEHSIIYTKKVLDIDEKAFAADLSSASQGAFNLAMDIAYPAAQTIEMLLQNAFRNGKSVAKESSFLADAIVEELIEQGGRDFIALKGVIPFEVKENPSSDPAVAPKTERTEPVSSEHSGPLTAEQLVKEVEHDPEIKKEQARLKEEKERKEVERLTQELKKKGTLRR